ncbi:hypothetical protein QF031_000605 [Pseudarthrobacter defluvii]|uniref:hypothetical protein n=1 Tax=Pseudarthrobacter defluvii TaxID=410837 RepID=UPI00278A0EBC|nr:hypothetical protein [Pseudarthrobacter defluvii]MDQ0767856.1 hypothetical protein [Pseudarthrobacter defluvii]
MTTRAAASLLRRAWLLAAALAVIAGLLGMHVLTSGHGSHGTGSNALHEAVSNPSHGDGHAAVAPSAAGDLSAHAAHHAAAAAVDAPGFAFAACGDSCPNAQESGAPCVPSAPSGPVTISPPQASLAALPLLPTDSGAGSAYYYLPPSPTPCDLSISRT